MCEPLGTVRWVGAQDASCRDAERQIIDAIALPENRGMQVVASEHFNPTDLSVAAQVARIKAAAPQGVFVCASGTVFGTVVHGLHDGGLDVPTAASSSNMNVEQLHGYADLLPHELYFGGPRGIVEDTLLRPGPVKEPWRCPRRSRAWLRTPPTTSGSQRPTRAARAQALMKRSKRCPTPRRS